MKLGFAIWKPARIVRKSAVEIVHGREGVITVELPVSDRYLGKPPFKPETPMTGVGVVTGLAWTAMARGIRNLSRINGQPGRSLDDVHDPEHDGAGEDECKEGHDSHDLADPTPAATAARKRGDQPDATTAINTPSGAHTIAATSASGHLHQARTNAVAPSMVAIPATPNSPIAVIENITCVRVRGNGASRPGSTVVSTSLHDERSDHPTECERCAHHHDDRVRHTNASVTQEKQANGTRHDEGERREPTQNESDELPRAAHQAVAEDAGNEALQDRRTMGVLRTTRAGAGATTDVATAALPNGGVRRQAQ